jgi:hypothetical protein
MPPDEKTISYKEMGVVLSSDENRQTLHKEIYDVISKGEDMASGRNVVFNVCDHPSLNSKFFCIIRGQSFIEGLSCREMTKTFTKGENCNFILDLVITNSKGTRIKSGPEIQHKIQKTFSRHGIKVNEYSFPEGIQIVHVKKTGRDNLNTQKFHLPYISLSISGVIEEPDRIAEAWLKGVGRNKGYGFGMLREQYA